LIDEEPSGLEPSVNCTKPAAAGVTVAVRVTEIVWAPAAAAFPEGGVTVSVVDVAVGVGGCVGVETTGVGVGADAAVLGADAAVLGADAAVLGADAAVLGADAAVLGADALVLPAGCPDSNRAIACEALSLAVALAWSHESRPERIVSASACSPLVKADSFFP
jgi:hypothetical protein